MKRRHRFLGSVIVSIYICILVSSGNTLPNIDVTQAHSDTLILKINFGSVNPNGSDNFIIQERTDLFFLADAGDFHAALDENHSKILNLPKSVRIVKDRALGDTPFESEMDVSLSRLPVETTPLGSWQKQTLYQVIIHRYVSSGGVLKDYSVCQFRITGKSIRRIENSAEIQTLLAEIYQKKQAGLSKTVTAIRPVSADRKRLKIWVQKEGIYVIPRPLITNAGWDVRSIDPRYLRMTTQGREVPIRVVGGEDGSFDLTDYVEFWGEELWRPDADGHKQRDIYSNANIYWLESGDSPGVRFAVEDGQPAERKQKGVVQSDYYLYTYHHELDQAFNRLAWQQHVSPEDHFLMGGTAANREKLDISLPLAEPAADGEDLVQVRIKLFGQTESFGPQPFDLFLNQNLIGESSWQRYEKILYTSSPFSSSYLNDSYNSISIVNRSQEFKNDVMVYANLACDWIEITYPRFYKAVDDFILFNPPPNSHGKRCRFEITDFLQDQITLYKIGLSQISGHQVREVLDTLGNRSYTLVFEDDVAGETQRYVALTPDQKLLPDSVARVGFQDFTDPGLEADYVIVTPADSLRGKILQPLISLRQAQGLTVRTFDFDTICNSFTHGIHRPEAVNHLLQFGLEHWQTKPRYLLLIGDGHYQCRLSRPEQNLMPIHIYNSYKFGGVVSDHIYTLLEGNDHIPDMAVGRFPIRRIEELSALVQKTVTYETAARQTWMNRYLLIGSDGPPGGIFYTQSETLIDAHLPKRTEPERLYLKGRLNDPYFGSTEELFQFMNEGVGLINFRGHGGGAIWNDAGLLTLDHIPELENSERLPFITSMTCFTCDFSSNRTSLGEALVLAENGGAIGFWGASGVGWTSHDFYFIQIVYDLLNTNPELTWGEVIQQAKTRFLLVNSGDIAKSDVYQYIFIGDPAIRTTFPGHQVNLSKDIQVIGESDPVQVQGTSGLDAYKLQLDMVDSEGETQLSQTKIVNQSSFEYFITRPENLNQGGVRLYLWDDQGNHENAYFSFQAGEPLFDSLRVSPSNIFWGDSLWVSADIYHYQTIQEAFLHLIPVNSDSSVVFPDSVRMILNSGTSQYHSLPFLKAIPGLQFQYFISMSDLQNDHFYSDTLNYILPASFDLFVDLVRLSGSSQPELQARIGNFSNVGVRDVEIRYSIPELNFVYSDKISAERGERVYSTCPVFLPVGKFDVNVVIDPDRQIPSQNTRSDTLGRTIETDHFQVSPGIGSTWNGVQNDTVGLDTSFLCYFPPNAVSEARSIHLQRILEYTGDYSPDTSFQFDPALLVGNYQVNFTDTTGMMTEASYTVILDGPAKAFPDVANIYYFNTDVNRWTTLPFSRRDSVYTFQTRFLGSFVLKTSQDTEPPWVDVRVDDQTFANGSYFSNGSIFTFQIEDESGIDIRDEKLQILLDQQKVPVSEITWSDSVAGLKKAILNYQPELQPGQHILDVSVSDIHGNQNQLATLQFQVSDRLDVHFLGNYPNPFESKFGTTFVYEMTSRARRVSLKIYTVSGRLIRTFDDYGLAAADYHEIFWDGRDEWGNEIGNGVYFYKFHVQGEEPLVLHGKIAKLDL